jgi:hypothetical protein
MTRRIERAKALLQRGDRQVTEVCLAVGCTSPGSFSSRFTELVGESPSSYRARRHDQGAAIPACIAKIHTRPVRNGAANPAPRPKRPAGSSARNPWAAEVSCPGGSGQHPAGLREGTGSRPPLRCLGGEPSHHQPERDDHRPPQRRVPRGEHPHRHRRAEHQQHPATAGRCPSWTAASSARSPSPTCALKPGCPGPPPSATRSPQWSRRS